MNSKIKITIEYDGNNYCGWQFQSETTPTVQNELEKVCLRLFEEKINVIAAGRTDSGVHALNQVAHFQTTRDLSNYNLNKAFQSLLPRDIVIKKIELVPQEFHAQRSAVGKTYLYKIWNHENPTALDQKRALWVRKPLDLDKLNAGAALFVGTHDFNALRSEGTPVNSTIRTINSAKFIKSGDFIEFRVNGDGFLKQMVRNMMGTLLQLELNERTLESIPELLKSRDRTKAGPTVAPHGLYLEKVFYPPELDKSAQSL